MFRNKLVTGISVFVWCSPLYLFRVCVDVRLQYAVDLMSVFIIVLISCLCEWKLQNAVDLMSVPVTVFISCGK